MQKHLIQCVANHLGQTPTHNTKLNAILNAINNAVFTKIVNTIANAILNTILNTIFNAVLQKSSNYYVTIKTIPLIIPLTFSYLHQLHGSRLIFA